MSKGMMKKPRAPRAKEVQLAPIQEVVLFDQLTETGVTLAQVRRALRALRPGSRVFEKGVNIDAVLFTRYWAKNRSPRPASQGDTVPIRVPAGLVRGAHRR
ncbi:MAG: hypothetical protein WAV09_03140 [Minisyncoccia bacterium]